ncbi:modular serine protease-like [Condylostylus longicornis]|uniref:modular serine protease-like n=1 Tax=Condylostylus longicornis TaxID=2530218 RepID=UPI00244DEEFC|nr:modular serine protease-like [Condylostylus longicornis]
MYKSLITKSANYAQKQLNSTIDLGCHIPRIRHVLFLENSTNSVLIAGTYVPSLTTITYACPKGLFFDGDHSTNTCYGDWINSHPECTEICPPVAHDHTVKLNCNYKRKKISCDKPFRPGTIIKISCAFMYQKPLNVHVHDKIQCQSDGDWDHSVFKCKQICGIFDKELSNEKNQLANIYRAPWHIAMYHTTYDKTMYKFICAGTLVKSRVVMSVAHCFWPDIRLEVFDKGIYSEYKIVAGKLFQDYYSNKDKGLIQETEIMDVTIPVQYEGQTYDYVSDIAIILLKDHIIFTNHIRPACLLWQPYEKKNLPENKEGRIAGWALLNFDEMDKGIRSIQYISVNECKNYTTVYKVSSDKFCTKLGKENNICSSGTGLLIPEDINGTTLYNLWGILSLDVTGSPRDKCSNSVVAFSNVQWYESLIETIINEKFNL